MPKGRRYNERAWLTGKEGNDLQRQIDALNPMPSDTVKPHKAANGTTWHAQVNAKVAGANPWHPFRIYPAPSGGENGWRTFRVRSGRVGVVFPPNVVDSDGVVDPYGSEQPVVATDFLMPGYVGRFWFWLEIGDGFAIVHAQSSGSGDPEALPVVSLPTQVDAGGDFVNIHPVYRPIGYFEVLDPNTRSTRIVQNLVADLVGPMVNLCSVEGDVIGYPVPIS